MKNYLKSTMAFGIALSMLAAPVAMAQQDQHDNGQQGQFHADQKPGEPDQHATAPQHVEDQHMQQPPAHHDAPSQHHWQNGSHYTGSRHVVNRGDWDRYHLRQPPQGYEWVQDGNQFVLIAIGSGIIAQVLANALNH